MLNEALHQLSGWRDYMQGKGEEGIDQVQRNQYLSLSMMAYDACVPTRRQNAFMLKHKSAAYREMERMHTR